MENEIKELITYMKEQKERLEVINGEKEELKNNMDRFDNKESSFYKDAEAEYNDKANEYSSLESTVNHNIKDKKDAIRDSLTETANEIDELNSDLNGKYAEIKNARQSLEGAKGHLKWVESTITSENKKEMVDSAKKTVKDREYAIALLTAEIRIKQDRLAEIVPEGKEPSDFYIELQDQIKAVDELAFDNIEEIEGRFEEEPSVPTSVPTSAPTSAATTAKTTAPTSAPTSAATAAKTTAPTSAPTSAPTTAKTTAPTSAPTSAATTAKTTAPTSAPTSAATTAKTTAPTSAPTSAPTTAKTTAPTSALTSTPSTAKTTAPTSAPTKSPKDYVKFKISIGRKGLKITYPDLGREEKFSLKDLKELDKWDDEEIKKFLNCPTLTGDQIDLIDPTLMTALSRISEFDKVPKDQMKGIIDRYLHSLVSDKKLEGAKALKDIIEYDKTNLEFFKFRNIVKNMMHKRQYNDIKKYSDIAEKMGIAEIKPDHRGKISQFFSNTWNKIPLIAARKDKLLKEGSEAKDSKYSDPKKLTSDQKALAEAMEKYRQGEIGYQEEIKTGFKGKMASFKKGLSYEMMTDEERKDVDDKKEANKARANAFAIHTTIEDKKDSKPKSTPTYTKSDGDVR